MENGTEDVISKVVEDHDLYSTLEALWVHPGKEARKEHLEEYESKRSYAMVPSALNIAEEIGYVERFDGVASDGEFSRYQLTEEGEEALQELADFKLDENNRNSIIAEAVEKRRYDREVVAEAASQLLE